MLTAIVLVQNLKWVIPATLILGSMPAHLMVALLWKILSAPFPSWVFFTVEDFLFTTTHRQAQFYFELLSGVEVIFYGDVEHIKKGENCICMSNHQSTVDWIFGGIVAHRCGSLERTRFIIKDGLKFIPWYGVYFELRGGILVKRAKKFDKERAKRQLAQNAKDKKPMWLIVFPEGTRYNPSSPDIIKASKEFAKSQGLAPLESLLFPRSKAMQLCWEELKENLDCFYDVTIAYGKTIDFETKKRLTAPSMPDVLLGLPQKIHIHMRRIPIDQVPHDEIEMKQWLHEQFQEKDKLLTDFYKAENEDEARFKGPSKTMPLSLKDALPSVILWSGGLIAICAFKKSRELYAKLVIGSAALGIVWMAIKR